MDPEEIGLLVFLTEVSYEVNNVFFFLSFCLVLTTENGYNWVHRIAESQQIFIGTKKLKISQKMA